MWSVTPDFPSSMKTPYDWEGEYKYVYRYYRAGDCPENAKVTPSTSDIPKNTGWIESEDDLKNLVRCVGANARGTRTFLSLRPPGVYKANSFVQWGYESKENCLQLSQPLSMLAYSGSGKQPTTPASDKYNCEKVDVMHSQSYKCVGTPPDKVEISRYSKADCSTKSLFTTPASLDSQGVCIPYQNMNGPFVRSAVSGALSSRNFVTYSCCGSPPCSLWSPTLNPTAAPSPVPTTTPTVQPTPLPTATPTAVPTALPTNAPTVPVLQSSTGKNQGCSARGFRLSATFLIISLTWAFVI